MAHLKRYASHFKYQLNRARAYVSKPLLIKQRAYVPLENEVCQNPIFILGVHRSGTSLLRRILDSHSEIACPPETFFLKKFCDLYRDPGTRVGLKGFGIGELDEEFRVQIASWASRYHEAYRQGCGKKRWADKTPYYIDCAYDLAKLFGPEAQFIALFRHPFDIVFSIYTRGWKLGAYHEDPFIRAINYVERSINQLADFVDSSSTSIFLLKYETLTDAPEMTLRRLFSFLNLAWEDEVLRFNQHHHNFGTEDPVVSGTNKISKGNSNGWRALEDGQINYMRQRLQNSLRRLDYLIPK